MTVKRTMLWVVMLAWMVVIFWFSSAGHVQSSGQSTEVMNAISRVTGVALPEIIVRKTAHVANYTVLGVLVHLLLRDYKLRARTILWLGTVIVCVYAATDELHQLMVPGRTGQVTDVLLDTTAGLVAITVTVVLQRMLTLRKSQK